MERTIVGITLFGQPVSRTTLGFIIIIVIWMVAAIYFYNRYNRLSKSAMKHSTKRNELPFVIGFILITLSLGTAFFIFMTVFDLWHTSALR